MYGGGKPRAWACLETSRALQLGEDARGHALGSKMAAAVPMAGPGKRAEPGSPVGGALASSPRLEWGWERMDSEKQRPAPGAGLGAASSCPPPPTPTRHSLLRHPGVLEGDEDQVQTVQPRAVELSVEFISQLLLQLAVVLFCVHLGGARRGRLSWSRQGSRKAASLPAGRRPVCVGGGGLGSIPSSLGSLAKKLRPPGGLPGPSSPGGRDSGSETSSLLLDLGKGRLPQGQGGAFGLRVDTGGATECACSLFRRGNHAFFPELAR